MNSSEIGAHEQRRAWWSRVFEEASALGVEQISDEELIMLDRLMKRGEGPRQVARQMWGPDPPR